jgi:hypothetical protein
MPDQAEMRRQMLAYKQQVHELRLAYAKELQANAQQAEERKKAAAKLSARGNSSAAHNVPAGGRCGTAADVFMRHIVFPARLV